METNQFNSSNECFDSNFCSFTYNPNDDTSNCYFQCVLLLDLCLLSFIFFKLLLISLSSEYFSFSSSYYYFQKKSKRNKQKRNWSLFAGCICYPYGVYFLGGHSNKMVIINWHHVVICAFFLSIRAIWPTGLIVMIDCTEAEPLSHFCRRVTSPSRRRVPVDSHRENGRLYGSTFRIRAVGQ